MSNAQVFHGELKIRKLANATPLGILIRELAKQESGAVVYVSVQLKASFITELIRSYRQSPAVAGQSIVQLAVNGKSHALIFCASNVLQKRGAEYLAILPPNPSEEAALFLL